MATRQPNVLIGRHRQHTQALLRGCCRIDIKRAPERWVGKLVTDWSFRTPTLSWFHVALVNDGKTTKLYINGSEDVRNSHDLSVGLQSTGEFWMVGATQYARTVGPALYGWLGDVRIVNRPLTVREFMVSR